MADEKVNKFAPKKVVADEKTKTAKVVQSKPVAAVKPVKTAKVEKAEPTEDTRKITLLTKENPKREGSASHDRFELYTKSKTVADFLEAGGTTADVRYDAAKGYIKVA